jgi:hypothetical protein
LAEFQELFPSLCQRLLTSRRAQRIGQAYLFVGDGPDLLSRFVTAWAQVCICQTPQPNGDACGHCEHCTRLADGSYAERSDLRPESKTRQITVDSMRAFDNHLNLATEVSQPKIAVIAEAECLGQEAQNAFLKTLEEPPPNTLLLLCTTQPRLLLPTIRSRCQIVPVLGNRVDYSALRQRGLFRLLGPLRRQAGAAVGLRVSAHLQALFRDLEAEAEKHVGSTPVEERWAVLAAADPKLTKRLREEHGIRVSAEYVRLRRVVEDGVHAWFLQQCLLAAGVRAELLPHPEFLADLPDSVRQASATTPDEADEDLRAVDQLLRALRASLNEALALDAFCLAVSAKTALTGRRAGFTQ